MRNENCLFLVWNTEHWFIVAWYDDDICQLQRALIDSSPIYKELIKPFWLVVVVGAAMWYVSALGQEFGFHLKTLQLIMVASEQHCQV